VSAANSHIEFVFRKTENTRKQQGAKRWRSILRIARKGDAAGRLRSLMRISFRWFAPLVGLALLGYLVFRTGPSVVWKQLEAVGWGVALIIVLGGFSQLVKTCSWRQGFTCDISGIAWSRSFVGQLLSDSIGQFGVAGKVLGEGVRISLLGRTVPVSNAISAGAIDGALHTFTAVLVTVLGLTATLLFAPLSAMWRGCALLFVAVLLAIVILAATAARKRWHLTGNVIRAFGRLPRVGIWIAGKQPIIDSAEDDLLGFHDEAPTAFWAVLMLNLLWHLLAMLEVYVILRFMGMKIAAGGAFQVESLTKVINLVGAFNPGNFGTYEVGNMMIARICGVTSTAGLTLALCRRVRTAFWAGVGAMCMIAIGRADLARSGRSEDGLESDILRSRELGH
jgi:glycosyltransferase 2 family protein